MDPLSLRLIGVVGARDYVRSSFSVGAQLDLITGSLDPEASIELSRQQGHCRRSPWEECILFSFMVREYLI